VLRSGSNRRTGVGTIRKMRAPINVISQRLRTYDKVSRES